jgi:alkylation response protein AidB-like acyl-CoA dehydrogenase
MNFDLSEEQVLLRDAAARFVREQYEPERRRAVLANSPLELPQLWRQYAEFGWLGLCVDEAYGGLGCSFADVVVLMEQLGAGFVADPLASTIVATPSLLQSSGREDLCRQWLPGIVSGEVVLTLANEEQGRCGTRSLPGMRAVRRNAAYVLSGTKTLVQGGAVARCAIVSACVERGGVPALGLFLVDCNAPGVAVTTYSLVDGRRCADLVFDNVRCGDDALVLWGDAAVNALSEALDRARVAAMAEAVGGMEACMAMTADYLQARTQFGRPIGKFQALQHTMAEMFVDVQDARSVLYRALAHLDAAPHARRRAVACAQLVVGEAGRRATAAGVQLHGGYGLTDEYAISHGFRQQLVLEKLWGDAQDALARMDWET